MEKFNYSLIIDDDPVSTFLTNSFLKKSGICNEVLISRNGKEAIRLLEKNSDNPPGLILLDLNMPIMDGFEFLEIVNPSIFNKNKTKLIVHSLNSNLESIKEKYSVEIINKPLTFEKFFIATKRGFC